jgi:transcription antitermination factor NusG
MDPDHDYHQGLVDKYPAALKPNFEIGDRVEIISGPYKGLVSDVSYFANQWHGVFLSTIGSKYAASFNWRELKKTKKELSPSGSFDDVAYKLYPMLKK